MVIKLRGPWLLPMIFTGVSHSLDYAYSIFTLLPLPSNWVRQKQPLIMLLYFLPNIV